MPLDAVVALQGMESVAGHREHCLAPADAPAVGPADRADQVAGRATQPDLGGNPEGDEPVHHLPGGVLGGVEWPPLVEPEGLVDRLSKLLEAGRGRGGHPGGLELGDDQGHDPRACRPRRDGHRLGRPGGRLVVAGQGVGEDLAGRVAGGRQKPGRRLPAGNRIAAAADAGPGRLAPLPLSGLFLEPLHLVLAGGRGEWDEGRRRLRPRRLEHPLEESPRSRPGASRRGRLAAREGGQDPAAETGSQDDPFPPAGPTGNTGASGGRKSWGRHRGLSAWGSRLR